MSGADEAGWGLIMPFVVVASKGGRYDDESFAAGWMAAEWDCRLAQSPPLTVATYWGTVRGALVPQLDLIAMRHGFRCISDPDRRGEWVTVCVTNNQTETGETP